MKSVLRFVNKSLPPPVPPTSRVGCCSTVLRGVVSRHEWINSQGDTEKRDPSSEGKSVALPLSLPFTTSYRPSLRFLQEASVSSRLYRDNVLRGSLRARVYACVVNAISSRSRKRDLLFSFLFLLINDGWIFRSSRLITMISNFPRKLETRCCLPSRITKGGVELFRSRARFLISCGS